MRTRTFEVPADLIVEFAEVICENELEATIEGYDTDEDEVTIEIEYDAAQRDLMHELQNKVDDYYEENDDDD